MYARNSSHFADLACVAVALAMCGVAVFAQKPPTFADPVTFCTLGVDNEGDCIGSRPMGLVVADLVDLPGEQDDGYPDVAVTNSDVNGIESVTVFHNTGDWSVPADALVRTGTFPVGWSTFPYEIKAADVSHPTDGDLDLVVTLYAASQIVILENLGQGEFGQAQFIDISPLDRDIYAPMGLVVGDFDLDNRLDIAVAATDDTANVAAVVLFWKQPDGDWDKVVLGAEHDMPWGCSSTDIVAGAVAKKAVSPAYQDLVLAAKPGAAFDPYLVTLVNLSQRQFAPGILSPAPPDLDHGPMGIALGRFRTGVVQPDLVAADEFHWDPVLGDSADVYWNDAFGHFAFQREYLLQSGGQVGHDPYSVAVGKINADTRQDIVSTIGHDDPCNPGGGIAVFVGHGDGTFHEPPYLFCVDPDPNKEPKPKFVEIADMDQDTFNDVVTSNNWNGHNISVLINAFGAIPPG